MKERLMFAEWFVGSIYLCLCLVFAASSNTEVHLTKLIQNMFLKMAGLGCFSQLTYFKFTTEAQEVSGTNATP